MSAIRKMVMKPFESEENTRQSGVSFSTPNDTFMSNNQQQIKSFRPDKITQNDCMRNIMKLFSRIALINGYNDDGNIRGKYGNFISNTDIVGLIMHSMRRDRILNGEQDFINLLNEAKIEANWIINPKIKRVMGIKSQNGEILQQAKLSSEVKLKEPVSVESASEEVTNQNIPRVPSAKSYSELTDLNKRIIFPKGEKRNLEIIEPPSNSLKRVKIN